jgi:hypothetical protein
MPYRATDASARPGIARCWHVEKSLRALISTVQGLPVRKEPSASA